MKRIIRSLEFLMHYFLYILIICHKKCIQVCRGLFLVKMHPKGGELANALEIFFEATKFLSMICIRVGCPHFAKSQKFKMLPPWDFELGQIVSKKSENLKICAFLPFWNSIFFKFRRFGCNHFQKNPEISSCA